MGLGGALDVSSSLMLGVGLIWRWPSMENWGCYWTQLLTTQKSVLERGGRCWQKGKLPLIRMRAVWADGGLIVLAKTGSKDSAQLWKFLKGKGKSSHLIIEMGGQCHFHHLPHAGLLTSCDPSRDACLVHSLFVRLLKGKPGKRSGHLLIT